MHFSLVKYNPENTPPSHGFDDAIFPLYYALQNLGYTVEILFNRCNPKSRNIIFGSCIAPRKIGRQIPRKSIIFNLEQMNEGSKWCNKDYLVHLNDYAVWDYSLVNVNGLQALGISGVTHTPLGYVPQMTRLAPEYPAEVDAVFYGLLTERRDALIRRMVHAGNRVLASQEAFGDLRDKLLATAKVVLNIHQFLPARLEVVRLGYVWANRRPVLSEYRQDGEIPDHLREACCFATYDNLPDELNRLLADKAALQKLATDGFTAFSSQPMTSSLEKIIGRRTGPAQKAPIKSPPPYPLLQNRPYLQAPAHEWLITNDSLDANAPTPPASR
ncbi:hypothetical protein LJC46_07100 [Desulfovibrio sp. OttesenSCG-928-G15]|nr:hypothetical protein [Desulfovibrio sp. OttesenSCG-928-G15]